MRAAFLVFSIFALGLGGCATVTKGTTQPITISSNPPGADCDLRREGAGLIAQVRTPGTVEVSKSFRDIQIRCNKAGYQETVATLSSQAEAMTFGNVLVGGLVGFAIDAGTGAMTKYDGTITVPLVPEGAAPKQPIRPSGSGRPII
ncbi:MAG: translation initiation factor 2 [Pseudomonadota bacterium]